MVADSAEITLQTRVEDLSPFHRKVLYESLLCVKYSPLAHQGMCLENFLNNSLRQLWMMSPKRRDKSIAPDLHWRGGEFREGVIILTYRVPCLKKFVYERRDGKWLVILPKIPKN